MSNILIEEEESVEWVIPHLFHESTKTYILELIIRHRETGLTPQEIADLVNKKTPKDVVRSTVYKHLETLKTNEVIHKTGEPHTRGVWKPVIADTKPSHIIQSIIQTYDL